MAGDAALDDWQARLDVPRPRENATLEVGNGSQTSLRQLTSGRHAPLTAPAVHDNGPVVGDLGHPLCQFTERDQTSSTRGQIAHSPFPRLPNVQKERRLVFRGQRRIELTRCHLGDGNPVGDSAGSVDPHTAKEPVVDKRTLSGIVATDRTVGVLS